MELQQRQSLTSDVKGTLLSWIREGRYTAGSQLPSVQQLVEQLGVSRTVVREALQTLNGMDLIDMRPGMGCFVRSVPPNLIMNADIMAALIDTDAMRYVVHARLVLESAVAGLAATEATEDDFDEMQAIVDRLGASAELRRPVFALTPEFHVAIAKGTHNPILESVIRSFNALMAKTGELLENDAGDGYRQREYISHRTLLRVLRRRDPQAAQEAMRAHIQETVDSLDRLLGPRVQTEAPVRVGA